MNLYSLNEYKIIWLNASNINDDRLKYRCIPIAIELMVFFVETVTLEIVIQT